MFLHMVILRHGAKIKNFTFLIDFRLDTIRTKLEVLLSATTKYFYIFSLLSIQLSTKLRYQINDV